MVSKVDKLPNQHMNDKNDHYLYELRLKEVDKLRIFVDFEKYAGMHHGCQFLGVLLHRLVKYFMFTDFLLNKQALS